MKVLIRHVHTCSIFKDFKVYFQNTYIFVFFLISKLKPPQDLDEIIKVKGIEQTDRYGILILACVKSRQNERLTVERQLLCNIFNGGAPITIRQILNYLPFRAKVHVTGQGITSMDNVRVSRRVLAQMQNPSGSQNPASARGECTTAQSGGSAQGPTPPRFSTAQSCTPTMVVSSGRFAAGRSTSSTEGVAPARFAVAHSAQAAASARYTEGGAAPASRRHSPQDASREAYTYNLAELYGERDNDLEFSQEEEDKLLESKDREDDAA